MILQKIYLILVSFFKKHSRIVEKGIFYLFLIAVGAFVTQQMNSKPETKKEQPAQEIKVDQQTAVAKKDTTQKIKQEPKILKIKELQGYEPIRKIEAVSKLKSTGEEITTTTEILRNQDGNTRSVTTVSDNQELLNVQENVLADIPAIEVQKPQRIYAEARTYNNGEIALGFEKRINKHSYYAIEVSKTRNDNPRVGIKVGVDF